MNDAIRLTDVTKTAYFDDVWASKDGQGWTRSSVHAEFGKRSHAALVSFKGKLWLIGGSVLEGDGSARTKADIWRMD